MGSERTFVANIRDIVSINGASKPMKHANNGRAPHFLKPLSD